VWKRVLHAFVHSFYWIPSSSFGSSGIWVKCGYAGVTAKRLIMQSISTTNRFWTELWSFISQQNITVPQTNKRRKAVISLYKIPDFSHIAVKFSFKPINEFPAVVSSLNVFRLLITLLLKRNFSMILYDVRCYFNMRPKADKSQLNLLQHLARLSFYWALV